MPGPVTAQSHPCYPAEGSTPRVWLVSGYRAGERSQILALGEALGWPYELKEMSYRKSEFRTSLFRGSDLRGIRLKDSAPLEPPWPDLVISAGMRNEPVGRWIRARSGGRTRIVHIGRPWAKLDQFDLVITTPQYRLPERDNVLHNLTTLHRATQERLVDAAHCWEARFEHLPKPWTGVILGGNSGPYTLGPKVARSIALESSTMAGRNGGSLLVSTSARTPEAVTSVFEQTVTVPHYLYRWKSGDADNPYFAILGLSHELIVTADSIAMLSEACSTGKPVYMADLGGFGYPMRPDRRTPVDFRLTGLTYSWMMRAGPRRLSRDIRLVHQRLLAEGQVVWLGERFDKPPLTGSADLQRAVERVKSLFE